MKLYLLLFLLLLLPFTYSIGYYIDEDISIKENGDVVISGSTNLDFLSSLHPVNEQIIGSTQELTQKKGKYWLFTYESSQEVEAALIKVSLPKGAVINYIGSELKASISTENNIITIVFTGENKPLDIKMQYILPSEQEKKFNSYWVLIPFIAFIIILAIIFLAKRKKPEKIDKAKLEAIKPTLNETQIKIIDALIEKHGKCSQTAIQYMTGIPKASVSRNVELLVQKEIIQKFYNGTSNFLKIHPGMKR